MARKPLIAGNWKMNTTHLEAIQMVQKLHYRLDPRDFDRVDVVVAPPFTALRSVQTIIDADHMQIGLAAQNCDWRESGAYTGEVSPSMLAKLNVSYVIVGHSERRRHFQEDDDTVNRKAKAVREAGMTPVICLGESIEEREAGRVEEVVGAQVQGSLRGFRADDSPQLVVAYEPVWAIGTGKTASPEEAAQAVGFVRERASETLGDGGEVLRILYGGSVNPGNIAALMSKRQIDGALVGGASLDPDRFASIVRYWI